jgi:ribonuclease HI
MEITNTITELDIELNTEWVKGHQDDIKNTEVLSYASQLNIQADRLATSAWETY